MKVLLRIIQFIIIIVPIGFLVWLFNLNFVPSGVLEKSFDFSAPSAYADYLVPQQRVTGVMKDNGESFQQILEEPVYFHVHLPSSFDKMTVGVKFKPDTQSLLEYGPLITEEAWQYDLRPLYNKVLEDLGWPSVAKDGVKLYQRQSKYSSVQEFLSDTPPMNEIAVYNYTLESNYQIPGYQPRAEKKEYEIYLRGYHQFLTYVENEPLDFSFWIQDMNRGEGADPVVINLYKDNVAVDSLIVPDGELWRGQYDGSKVRRIDFKRNVALPGVYKIELKVPADIFVRRIATTQQKLVLLNTLFLGDEVGYSEHELGVELWTNSNYVVAETMHADGTQELGVNSELLKVSESHKEFYKEFGVSSDLNRIYSPQGDIKLTGNGLFSWDRNLYFNPYPIKLDANSDLDAQGINYVLSNYQNAEHEGEWYYNEQEFDLEMVPAPGGTIKFSISAPGVARRQAVPAIAEINLRFYREALTTENWFEIIKLYINKAIRRVL